MGTLYLVSTPIGNLEDITLRAKRILAEAEIIACEDTRKTGNLLKKLSLPKKQLISYFEENELRRIPQIVSLLREGENIALVTTAGTPTLSDPGFKLVRECLKKGIPVRAVPGASAILAALASSGLPTDKFTFLGFLPKKSGKRQKLLKNLASAHRYLRTTVVIFESPHRLLKTLGEMMNVLGDIEVAVCRELTKVHEEVRKEKISSLIKHFEKTKPKGEFTLILGRVKTSLK